MSLPQAARAARLYVKAEMMSSRIRLRAEAHRIMLVAFACFLCLIGLVFINVALYAGLVAAWGPILTPLALGLADFALAGLILGIAATRKPGPELEAAEELKAMAGASLEEHLQQGLAPAALLGSLGVGHGDSALRLLVPALTAIIGALRKRKAAA